MMDLETVRYFLEQGRKAQEAVDEILKPRTLPIPSPRTPAELWRHILARYDRVALAGGPQVGKTTLAATVTDRRVFHSDDFKQYPWEEVPQRMIEATLETIEAGPDPRRPRFIIEGVMVARALRKGLEVDVLVVLHAPVAPRKPGQVAMAKGIHTILDGLELYIPRYDLRRPVFDLDATK